MNSVFLVAWLGQWTPFFSGPGWGRTTQSRCSLNFVPEVLSGHVSLFLLFWVSTFGVHWLSERVFFSPEWKLLQARTVTSRVVVVFWLGTACEQVFRSSHDEAGARETGIYVDKFWVKSRKSTYIHLICIQCHVDSNFRRRRRQIISFSHQILFKINKHYHFWDHRKSTYLEKIQKITLFLVVSSFPHFSWFY